MPRFTRRRTNRPGYYLVEDAYGDVRWNDEVVEGRYGNQRGHLVTPQDLDGPGRNDVRTRNRADKNQPGRRTGKPRQNWRYRDEDGNLV